jgi:hypothetical protein
MGVAAGESPAHETEEEGFPAADAATGEGREGIVDDIPSLRLFHHDGPLT